MDDGGKPGSGQAANAGGLDRQTLDKLTALFLAEPSFRKLEKALGAFCPFEAMGVTRHEIRHSNFLAYILDPRKPHGFGSRMLERLVRTFLEQRAGGDVLGLTPLDIYLSDFSDADVRREWERVDVLAITRTKRHGLVVAVELKIEAGEHGDQLPRMRAAVEREWPEFSHLFVFLTPDRIEPSEKHGEGWTPVGLDSVLSAFEQELSLDEGGHPDARRLLQAYVAMLRRRYVSNTEHEKIAEELWRRHQLALEYLIKYRPDFGQSVCDIIYEDRDKICKLLTESTKMAFVFDSRRPREVRFAVKDWDEVDGFLSSAWTDSGRLILFCIKTSRESDRKFVVNLHLGKGTGAQRQRLFDRIRKSVPDINKKALASEWHSLVATSVLLKEQVDVTQAAEDVRSALDKFVQREAVKSIMGALDSMLGRPTP